MKLTSINRIVLAISLTLTLAPIDAVAGREHADHHNGDKQVVKIIAEADDGIEVFVKDRNNKNRYTFTFDELQDTDNVSSKLDDLDQNTKAKVMDLLSQLDDHDAKSIVLKKAEFEKGSQETEVFLVKTGDGEENTHIEIDIQGDGAGMSDGKHLRKMFVSNAKGEHSFHGKKKSKKHVKKMLKHLVEKGKLDDKDIAEIKAILDSKS